MHPSAPACDHRPQIPVSVFILTKNEERNLPDCLLSLGSSFKDVHVVDSFSSDTTENIAKNYGAKFVQHKFEGHTKQRAWALANIDFQHEWVFALDADHRVTPELLAELDRVFHSIPVGVDGFFVKRRQIFRGRWMRHGGYYPKYMMKIFRHSAAFLDENEFDYRFYVRGTTRKLENDILERNEKEWEINFFIEKHLKFASELASEEISRTMENEPYLVRPSAFGNSDERVLWLKGLWNMLPLYVRPFLLFFYRYFIRFGFLDGREGLVFYTLQSFWFRFIVDVRIEEILAHKRVGAIGAKRAGNG